MLLLSCFVNKHYLLYWVTEDSLRANDQATDLDYEEDNFLSFYSWVLSKKTHNLSSQFCYANDKMITDNNYFLHQTKIFKDLWIILTFLRIDTISITKLLRLQFFDIAITALTKRGIISIAGPIIKNQVCQYIWFNLFLEYKVTFVQFWNISIWY